MKNANALWGMAVLLLFVLGCSPRYYIPNTQNVPMIREQGEGSVVFAGNGNQYELQAAYGVAQGLAFQVNGALYLPKEEDNGNRGRGSMVEGGPGFFTGIGEHFQFDTYALIGSGRLRNQFPFTLDAYPATTGDLRANVLRLALQPSFSFHSNYLSATASLRAGRIQFSNIQGSLVFDGVNQQDYLANHSMSYLLEPALTFRVGPEALKLQIQAMKSFNMSHTDFRQDYDLLTLGLHLKF